MNITAIPHSKTIIWFLRTTWHMFCKYEADRATNKITRHRASTSSRWHFALGAALCCHRNETRAPIANPPSSALLDTPYHSSKLHSGPCSSVGMLRGAYALYKFPTYLLTYTQTALTNIHFASAIRHAKCNYARNMWITLRQDLSGFWSKQGSRTELPIDAKNLN